MSPNSIHPPIQATIAVTHKCNLSCLHCYYRPEMISGEDLALDKWSSVFEEFRDLGITNTVISGGEPFVREDIWNIIEGIVTNKMRFSILTNGTLISEKVANRLIPFRRRLDFVQVSIDGSNSDVHDALRGRGAFSAMLGGIEYLEKYGIPWFPRITFGPHNWTDLERLLLFLYRDMGIRFLSLVETLPRGAARPDETFWQPSDEDRRSAYQTIQQFHESHSVGIAGINLKLLGCPDDFIHNMRGIDRDGLRETGGFLDGCRVMFQKISILHSGEFVPCQQLPHLVLGKVGEDSLEDIWYNSTILDRLRNRSRIPLSSFTQCESCDFRMTCLGGCPAVAYAVTGDIMMIDPYDCYRQFPRNTSI